ncbi:MAG: helix-turn-helix domain-containing protein [Terriglobales bacterium]
MAEATGRKTYREAAPEAALAPWALCFWELAVPAASHVDEAHIVFPDGCCALLYSRQPAAARSHLRVVGPTLRPRQVPLEPRQRFWALRLQFAACREALGLDPQALRDQALDFGPLAPLRARALHAGLDGCGNFAQAAAVFSAALRRWRVPERRVDGEAAAAAAAIAGSDGTEPIAAVAARAGCGPRQLERRFRRAVGLSLKEFARARRIRAVATALAGPRGASWADLAATCGFADQSHLGHEIALTTGESPARFARRIRMFDAELQAAAMSEIYKTARRAGR